MRTLYFIMSGTLIGTGIAILIISKSLQLFGIWPLLVGLIGQWYGWKDEKDIPTPSRMKNRVV